MKWLCLLPLILSSCTLEPYRVLSMSDGIMAIEYNPRSISAATAIQMAKNEAASVGKVAIPGAVIPTENNGIELMFRLVDKGDAKRELISSALASSRSYPSPGDGWQMATVRTVQERDGTFLYVQTGLLTPTFKTLKPIAVFISNGQHWAKPKMFGGLESIITDEGQKYDFFFATWANVD